MIDIYSSVKIKTVKTSLNTLFCIYVGMCVCVLVFLIIMPWCIVTLKNHSLFFINMIKCLIMDTFICKIQLKILLNSRNFTHIGYHWFSILCYSVCDVFVFYFVLQIIKWPIVKHCVFLIIFSVVHSYYFQHCKIISF